MAGYGFYRYRYYLNGEELAKDERIIIKNDMPIPPPPAPKKDMGANIPPLPIKVTVTPTHIKEIQEELEHPGVKITRTNVEMEGIEIERTPLRDRLYFVSLKTLYWILLPIMIVKNLLLTPFKRKSGNY